ncbi:MAG: serine/threonine protein kinase [Planctomycetaceae bacterium]|nr:serine/threonine protein kinase [Planctomycetaceae bacterium]
MAIKLTVESFLAGVRQSGLIDEPTFEAFLTECERSHSLRDADQAAAQLVQRKLLTDWQASKLLQGKFKGFLLGRYRLMNLLGRGEMSSIYLAEHSLMKRRCAIKVLPANKVRDTSYLGRFQREAQAVASLNHPNIVRAYDVDMVHEAGTDIHFLVMEHVPGRNLEQVLDEEREISIVQAAEFIRQAAEGLSHAHEAGLIHRDIKPGNLLIDQQETVRLLDLGLARFFKETDIESLTIKHDEKVLGTADYLAPEQAVDSHAVDERADIYSLGCTLYFALTGTPPFTEGTLVQRLLAHQTKAPPAIENMRRDTPPELTAIVRRMMSKAKEDRYQTARDVADALGEFLMTFGGAEWRRQHPEIVARFTDIENLRPQITATTSVTVEEPVQSPGSPAAITREEASGPDDTQVPSDRPVTMESDPTDSETGDPAPLRQTQLQPRRRAANGRRPQPRKSLPKPPVPVPVWRQLMRFAKSHIAEITFAVAVILAVAVIVGIGVNLQAYSDQAAKALEKTEAESRSH